MLIVEIIWGCLFELLEIMCDFGFENFSCIFLFRIFVIFVLRVEILFGKNDIDNCLMGFSGFLFLGEIRGRVEILVRYFFFLYWFSF